MRVLEIASKQLQIFKDAEEKGEDYPLLEPM